MMKFAEHLKRARERAVREDMEVHFINTNHYEVINQDRSNRYSVNVLNKKIDSCTCPQFNKVGICKHMVKVAMSSRLAVNLQNRRA